MAEMHHDERGYTVTLTDREYDALKTKALERDALAAELAACKTARDGWTRASDAAHARIRVLESALTEVKAVLRETHGGRHYEPECPECVWLDGATALETKVVCPDWGDYHNFNAGRCSCGESNAQTSVDRKGQS